MSAECPLQALSCRCHGIGWMGPVAGDIAQLTGHFTSPHALRAQHKLGAGVRVRHPSTMVERGTPEVQSHHGCMVSQIQACLVSTRNKAAEPGPVLEAWQIYQLSASGPHSAEGWQCTEVRWQCSIFPCKDRAKTVTLVAKSVCRQRNRSEPCSSNKKVTWSLPLWSGFLVGGASGACPSSSHWLAIGSGQAAGWGKMRPGPSGPPRAA